MDKKEKDEFFPLNSTLNANIQPEKTKDIGPEQVGAQSPKPSSPKSKRIVCKFCGQEFFDEDEFKSHLLNKH